MDIQEYENEVIYKLDPISIEKEEKISFFFTKNDEIASGTEIEIEFYNGNRKERNERYLNQDGQRTEVEAPDKATEARITIKATLLTNAEETIKAIGNIEVKRYNRKIRGMLLKNGKIAYMVGKNLYYGETMYDFSNYISEEEHESKQQIVSYGAYILIFPLNLYLNTNTSEYGSLGMRYDAGNYENKVTFTMSDASGTEIKASKTKPTVPKNGDYWMDTSGEKAALYRYSDGMDMWVGVSTTHIKISVAFTGEIQEKPFPNMFEVGDTVFVDAGEEFKKGSVIVSKGNTKNDTGKITGGYIVVKGIIKDVREETVSTGKYMRFERKIPNMDYVCVSNNRVWGCYNGMNEEGKTLNEIYASKLGDPKNWHYFEGTATDSYALSLGDDGEFTGAFTYQGYPMFFKEDIIYKVYGTYPAAYQLQTHNCRGVQKGSFGSIAVVNEYLTYKSVRDFCVFDGNTPSGISENLGNEQYFEVEAGASMGKYYASAKDKNGEAILLVFDIEKGIWHKEDNLRIEEFAYNNSGELYGRNGLSIYGFANAKSVLGQDVKESEETVLWSAVTGEMDTEYTENKYVKALQIRAAMEVQSEINVFVSCNDENFKKIITLRGKGKTEVHRIPLNVKRNSYVRIKLEGRGACRIDSITKEIETGSDRK